MSKMVTYTVKFQFEVYNDDIPIDKAIDITREVCASAVKKAYPDIEIPDGV
jgi:hypothetical protein